ncbi:hypothetical protein FRC03_000010 [Tulasnella sp. 419]|nr:hypothetical protein FRC03_000010 [Tulasnella sp. 419]
MGDSASVSSSRPPSPTQTDLFSVASGQASQRHTPNLPITASVTPPYRFQWDKKQGPASISDATESRADLNAEIGVGSGHASPLNISLSGLGVGPALPSAWSSSLHGFNAISTVLNNPKSKPNPLKSSRAPFPSAISPDLPRVRRKDFDSYLKAITPEWERFQRNRRLAKEKEKEAEGEYVDEESTPKARSSAEKSAPPPLTSVPNVFFQPEFEFSDLKTFTTITDPPATEYLEPGGDLPPSSPIGEPSYNLEVQDRLSQYLDVVEQHLSIEISARSSSFFEALSNLQSLQAEGSSCLKRISQLRKQLQDVDERQAKKGLQIAMLVKKKENVGVVREGVRAIEAVGESVGLIRNLVSAGEYFEALGMIEEVEGMFDKRSPKAGVESTTTSLSGKRTDFAPKRRSSTMLSGNGPTLPLSSLNSLAFLPKNLHDLSVSISTSLSADLVALLKVDLTRDYSSPEVDNVFHDRISPLIQGLVRTGGVEAMARGYGGAALAEIKAVTRRHLPPSEWDEEEGSKVNGSNADGSISTKDLKALSHQEFMKLSRTMFATLLQRINTVASHITSLSNVISNLPSSSTATPAEVPSSLSELLSKVVELANTRASKVLSIRSIEHSQLPLHSFLEIFNLSWNFVLQSEVIARRMIVGLRGVVVGQAKSYLSNFHNAKIGESAKWVEDEVWAQVEVPYEAQRTVDLLAEAAVSDPKALVLEEGKESPSLTMNGNGPASPKSGPVKLLNIEDRTYYVVGATMQVLLLLVEYLKVMINLPLLTTDAMAKLIEFLKAFNSRTCQVVLGAGAMRSAGLKNITAKHLALASQSLSVMVALIPYVRETFRRHLNPKQAVILVEFDKLKRDYQEHQNEIHSKLIAIMGDRLSVHCRALSEIQWEVPSTKPGPNQYMEILVKETVTLHKVLSRYLAAPVVELIMSQVFAAINHQLSEEYSKIELPNQEAKTRMLQDARYLHEKFGALKGITAPLGMLETVVMEKSIPRKHSPFPTRRPAFSPSGGSVNGKEKERELSASGSPLRRTSTYGTSSPQMYQNGIMGGGGPGSRPSSRPSSRPTTPTTRQTYTQGPGSPSSLLQSSTPQTDVSSPPSLQPNQQSPNSLPHVGSPSMADGARVILSPPIPEKDDAHAGLGLRVVDLSTENEIHNDGMEAPNEGETRVGISAGGDGVDEHGQQGQPLESVGPENTRSDETSGGLKPHGGND